MEFGDSASGCLEWLLERRAVSPPPADLEAIAVVTKGSAPALVTFGGTGPARPVPLLRGKRNHAEFAERTCYQATLRQVPPGP
jgi:hypothetical protein